MRTWWVMAVVGVTLLSGCESTPDGGEAPPRVSGEDPDEPDEVEREAGVLRARELIPLRAGQVFWYEASLRAAPEDTPATREVALFAAWDKDFGLHLECLGLESSLRFMPKVQPGERKDLLYVLPGGLDEQGYVLDLRARTSRLQTVKTPAGSFQAVTLRHRDGRVEVEHCLAKGVGLVRYSIRMGDAEILRLELIRQRRQGPVPGTKRDTPAAFWKTYQEALRRLDVETLEELIAPKLRERLRWPASDAVGALGGPDPDVLAGARASSDRVSELIERIRVLIPELLDVQLEPTGLWQLGGEEGAHTATAKGLLIAWLEGRREVAPATIVLERAQGAEDWQLADFHR